MTKKKAKPTFEKALADLETIVKELESGELALETALERFEAGMALSRYCSQTLDEAEKRVSLLTLDESGAPREQPFPRDAP